MLLDTSGSTPFKKNCNNQRGSVIFRYFKLQTKTRLQSRRVCFFIGYLKHQIKKLNRTQRGLACYWIFQTTSKKLNSKQRVHIVIGYFTLPNSTEKLDCNLGRPVFYWIHQTQDKKTKLHLERACLLLDISDHLQKTK